jgi:hypothetical protein
VAEGVVPNNTKQNTKWAESTFLKWIDYTPNNLFPIDILHSHDAGKVCEVMKYFVLEVRKEDRGKYFGATVRSLLSALNRILKSNGAPFSILIGIVLYFGH